MNFFGHAAVARRIDDDPAFVLGAMAPDLLGMCAAGAGAATSPKIAAGQAHHFAVDARFHANPAFIALAGWGARALREAGLPRGPARGAAHIAIELFLDGVLAGDGQTRTAYVRCLADAETERAPFLWDGEASRQRWRTMIVRLRAGAIPDGYRDPDFVAARIAGALGGRPRLALAPGDAVLLREVLPILQRRVNADAHALTGPLFASPLPS